MQASADRIPAMTEYYHTKCKKCQRVVQRNGGIAEEAIGNLARTAGVKGTRLMRLWQEGIAPEKTGTEASVLSFPVRV